MNYIFLPIGLLIAGYSLFHTVLRPMGHIDLGRQNACDYSSRYDTRLTYQDTCPTNRSVRSIYYGPSRRSFGTGGLGPTPRRNGSTVRGFRGGGPGSGK